MSEKIFIIQVTAQELEHIGAGLNELPFKIARPLLEKLTMQYQQQSQQELPEKAE